MIVVIWHFFLESLILWWTLSFSIGLYVCPAAVKKIE